MKNATVYMVMAIALVGCVQSTPGTGAFDKFKLDSRATCDASSGAPLGESASLTAGDYRLTLVVTSGQATGATAIGRLWLRATAAGDRSTTGVVAHPDTLAHSPLYGATDLDLSAIGIHDQSVPADSTDPVFPGVLVHGAPGSAPAPLSDLSLWIASNLNRRDGKLLTDGGGIVLFVRRIADRGFSGDWGPAGLARTGTGRFCADRAR